MAAYDKARREGLVRVSVVPGGTGLAWSLSPTTRLRPESFLKINCITTFPCSMFAVDTSTFLGDAFPRGVAIPPRTSKSVLRAGGCGGDGGAKTAHSS